MKKITTILTALILIFTVTFIIGCKKDNGKTTVDPTKPTKQVITENDWKFTKGTALRVSQPTTIDTIVSFEPDYTITVLFNTDTVRFTYTNYNVMGDSIKAIVAYKTSLGAPSYGNDDTLIYDLKLDRTNFTLNGDKIKSSFVGGGYIRYAPANITLMIK